MVSSSQPKFFAMQESLKQTSKLLAKENWKTETQIGSVANCFENSSATSKEKHVAEKGFFTGSRLCSSRISRWA